MASGIEGDRFYLDVFAFTESPGFRLRVVVSGGILTGSAVTATPLTAERMRTIPGSDCLIAVGLAAVGGWRDPVLTGAGPARSAEGALRQAPFMLATR